MTAILKRKVVDWLRRRIRERISIVAGAGSAKTGPVLPVAFELWKVRESSGTLTLPRRQPGQSQAGAATNSSQIEFRNRCFWVHDGISHLLFVRALRNGVADGSAEGIARTVLLLGLNCGFYASDIIELKPEHFDGMHITKARAKNKRNGVQKGFVGKWKLWPETVAALRYGLKTKD